MPDSLHIAIDLGAGSGRVFLGGMGPGELLLEEVRRFHYPPRRLDGHLRWDFGRIAAEIDQGLRSAAARARDLERRVHSIGVDSWGVDYGLTDAAGILVEDPICYRDERTAGAMDAAFRHVPRVEIFRRTGIQFLSINTIFQLFAHAAAGLPDRAAHLGLVPDLINGTLTGRLVTEYTNATTTQMVSAVTGDWDGELVGRLGLPRHLLSPIVPTGTVVGPLLPHIASATGLEGVVVIAPATHDTGSAVAGTPLQNAWAYISSGTWSLVGVERERVLVDDTVARHNFTNEGGAFGTVRLLKNSMGLWILESCRQEWRAGGLDVDYALLLERAAAIRASCGLIFPDDPRFLNPPSMLAAVDAQMRETGQPVVSEPAAVTRVVLDSLALRYGSILRMIASITGRTVRGVQIVGGGSRNAYLNQATATVTGLPVVAGPVEATVIGNVMIQAIAAGRFASLAEARGHVAGSIESTPFEPRPSETWESARSVYAEIEGRFLEAQWPPW